MPEITRSGGRSAYYDRNPVQVTANFGSAAVIPHGSTSRWSYTVATGKKAFLQRALAKVVRQTVAAPAAQVALNIRYTPNGGSATTAAYAVIWGNAINDNDRDAYAGGGVMGSGDVLDCLSIDASTGG